MTIKKFWLTTTPNSRSYLNHFTQPDSIVPEQTQGVQAWDRYAYTNNNPVRYTDPTGHCLMVCTAIIGGVVSGLYNYASQVSNNLQSGKDWQTSLKSIDVKQLAVATAGGVVAGATMGLLAPGLIATAGIAGAAAAGGAANLVAGQYEALLSAGVDQSLDMQAGESFDKVEFNQTAANDGFLQPDVMVADTVSGAAVAGLTQAGLNQVLGPQLHPNIRMTASREALLEARGYVTGLGASVARRFGNFVDEIILRGTREVANPYLLDQDQ